MPTILRNLHFGGDSDDDMDDEAFFRFVFFINFCGLLSGSDDAVGE